MRSVAQGGKPLGREQWRNVLLPRSRAGIVMWVLVIHILFLGAASKFAFEPRDERSSAVFKEAAGTVVFGSAGSREVDWQILDETGLFLPTHNNFVSYRLAVQQAGSPQQEIFLPFASEFHPLAAPVRDQGRPSLAQEELNALDRPAFFLRSRIDLSSAAPSPSQLKVFAQDGRLVRSAILETLISAEGSDLWRPVLYSILVHNSIWEGGLHKRQGSGSIERDRLIESAIAAWLGREVFPFDGVMLIEVTP